MNEILPLVARDVGRLTAQLCIWALVVVAAGPLTAQEMSREKLTAVSAADALSREITRMSETLWDYSETALLEHRS
ncbi:MAG: hypothetical protein JSW51_05615, partial [Gemmatimonadota bacterium]